MRPWPGLLAMPRTAALDTHGIIMEHDLGRVWELRSLAGGILRIDLCQSGSVSVLATLGRFL